MNKLQTAIGMRLALAVAALSGPDLRRVLRREEGQTFVEYALILALISVALAASLTVLKDKIAAIFSRIGSDLS
jgi:pilus assembly protein Flp/PilA